MQRAHFPMGLPAHYASKGDNRSVIDQIVGSSVKSSNLFAVQDNIIAYAAGNGVAVCGVNPDDIPSNLIQWQKFYCANANCSPGEFSSLESSSANAYINMIDSHMKGSGSAPDEPRDLYGFNQRNTPIKAGTILEESPNTTGELALKSVINGSVVLASPSKSINRKRSTTYITISPNKKLMAVGESGYKPRVLIYSLASDLSRVPIAIIQEHTFGISSLAFLPNLQYLCSLGFINDGFIHVWKVSPNNVSLISSNKCTSVTNHMFWHDEYIITLGLRFIKVWKFEQESKAFSAATLRGKNVLLGSHIDHTFSRGCSLNSDELLVITDSSKLFLLKLNYDNLLLIPLNTPSSSTINCIGVDHLNENIWLGDFHERQFTMLDISELTKAPTNIRKEVVSPTKHHLGHRSTNNNYFPDHSTGQGLYNLGTKYLVYLSSDEEISVIEKSSHGLNPLIANIVNHIVGLKFTLDEHLIITKTGILNRLDKNLSIKKICQLNLPHHEALGNSLVCADMNGDEVCFGDRYGDVYIGNLDEQVENHIDIKFRTKAHESTVNDIAFMEIKGESYVCSISRDRMIQFFWKKDGKWDVLQTLPIHTGNLLQLFYHDGHVFVSSSDRTISIHEVVKEGLGEAEGTETVEANESEVKDSAKSKSGDLSEQPDPVVLKKKVLTLKSTPIAMKTNGDELIVSTSDKSINVYSLNSFELKRSFKLVDDLSNDSLLVDNFAFYKNSLITFASDKSLRVFQYSTGRPVSVSWGHLDSILGFSLNINEDVLVSIGTDGCIFKWNLSKITKPTRTQVASPTINNQVFSEESLPLYSKVTRKIIATPSSTIPQRRRLIVSPSVYVRSPSKDERLLSPRRLGSPMKEIMSPSPAPKLTSATLKRLESKKATNLSSESPSSESPTTRKNQSNITRKLYNAAPDGGSNGTHTSFQTTLSYISRIRGSVEANKFTENEKMQLYNSVSELLGFLGNKTAKDSLVQEQILEHYSDKLVEAFERKLLVLLLKDISKQSEGGNENGKTHHQKESGKESVLQKNSALQKKIDLHELSDPFEVD